MSRPCVSRPTLSLRQVLLDDAEPLPMETHTCITLSQQGAETQFGWFCTVETTSAPRPGTTKTERVAVPRPADRGRLRAVRIVQNLAWEPQFMDGAQQNNKFADKVRASRDEWQEHKKEPNHFEQKANEDPRSYASTAFLHIRGTRRHRPRFKRQNHSRCAFALSLLGLLPRI